ncbi:hypothetical protein B9T26_07590 [Acinetobacter sp. ANC 4169]|uniref:SdrD B-like domain-containing protein n=1 Tax=Acinetobacter sp. ANC 4169 TaxID=1977879 RepID=UPI000A33EF7D|nr:SdrD B-like domain-containing protein [Acinetobacter sp. ANC 4169]OTG73994.1 hypothetical protein B9T26_07590 [Acinetobacter sp. ANC 4169]
MKKAINKKVDALSLSALASALFFAQHGHAATTSMPNAGTIIPNIAYAKYEIIGADGLLHLKETQSNKVEVQISELYALKLSPDVQKVVEAGTTVYWFNELVNLSNTQATFKLSTENTSHLSNVRIYLDNGNNQFETNLDKLITDGIVLKPGEKVYLWVLAETSKDTPNNTQLKIPVTAKIQEGSQPSSTVEDPVTVVVPQLNIHKAVDKTKIQYKGVQEALTYTLTVKNNGNLPIAPLSVNVDGLQSEWIIVEDPLPGNTVYDDVSVNTAGASVLYKLNEGVYTTTPPTNKNNIGHAVVGYKNFPAGQESKITLKVKTTANLSYSVLKNQAYLFSWNSVTNQSRKTPSDLVQTVVEAADATLDGTTPDYHNVIKTAKVNEPVYLKANAAICNASHQQDQVKILVKSKLTGDFLYVNGKESEANSGIFHFKVDTAVWDGTTPNTADQILQTVRRDQVTATIIDCLDENGNSTNTPNPNISTDLLIDPYGIVFNAKTGKPVANARVILADKNGVPVGANIAFGQDASGQMTGTIPAEQLTNANGEFIYPFVMPGEYIFLVDTSSPINGKSYQFSSDQNLYPISSFNAFGITAVDADYSYGRSFKLDLTSPALNIDIPIDPLSSGQSLMVKKVALDSSVELGDFTNYSITVNNQGDAIAQDVKVQDTLPRGFSYVPNTMRVNGKPVSDPEGGKGPYLTLGLGDLAVNATAKIEYRVLVGPNALNGDGINRARAVSKSVTSNEAQAKVKVRPGVFSSDAFVIGKVYTDCNRNGMQDKGELGVPGVRLYMEDGSYVITDSEGKYDFYGVSPKTHVLKLDRTTLPAGVELVTQSNRNAGDPSSRFVDVKRGELHRADFAMADQAGACSAPLINTIKQRQEKINSHNLNLEKAINKQLSIDTPSYIEKSTRSDNTSGCLANDHDQTCILDKNQKDIAKDKQLAIDPVKPPVLVDLEEHLKRSDNNALSILNLKDGQILPFAQTTIQVQGMAGANQRVLINGQAVSEKRLGKLSVLADQQKQGKEFVGVELNTGKNEIRVEQLDFMGNVRESQQIQVVVPGEMHQLQLEHGTATATANGKDVLALILRLHDKDGVKIATRTSITLESDIGLINLPDLNPNEPGIQTFIEGGEMVIPVLAPNAPGRGKLRVSSGVLKQETDIQFLADLRPLIAVGLVEGSINFNNFDGNKLHSVTRNDGFEEQLNEVADWGNQTSLNGRAALFLKGKVKGDYLLTLAYDSDKSSNQRLFRDIQPDEYYPVYGDAAAKGFEAQSTSKLYVRVDKGRSYAMYGDYVTRTEKDEGLSLGQYNRSLTGLKLGHEGDRLQVAAFGAETKSRQVVTENRAIGISGPYSLGAISNDQILENSEKVEILTRDRNNPGLIISRQTLTRFVDYEVDTYSNSIYLKEAVASVDADLNPNYVRITVEADDIGEEYQVGGVSFSYAVKSHLKFGGSFVQSNDPLKEEQIASVNSVIKIGQHGKLIAEVAQSKNTHAEDDQITQINSEPTGSKDSGTAARVEFEYTPSAGNLRVYHQQAQDGFQNDAATISAGRMESGIKASMPIANVGLARIEAIRTEDQNNHGTRTGLAASIERNFFKMLAVEFGLRHYDETQDAATKATENMGTYNGTTARVKFTAKLPWKGASVFAEYEQDIANSEKQVVALGGTVKVLPNTDVYARHEVISSIDGLYSLNTTEETNSTVLGISSNYMKDGSAFSEYRVADGMSNREAEAALGLRNRWQIMPQVYLSTSFEQVKTLSKNPENDGNDSTAATFGLEYLAPKDWKAMTRLEGRRSDQSNTLISTLGYAHKLNERMTILTKNTLNFVNNKAAEQGDHLRNRFQLGMAWRDFDQNKLDVLSKVEHYYENNATDLEAEFKRTSYVSSTHVNWHPSRPVTLSGQYAAKWSVLDEYDVRSTALTQLVSGRVLYDINERWDASLQTGVLWANRGTGSRYLLGAEFGYLVTTNLWLSAGYNFLGYQDDELANTSSTGQGAYLRFRFKFDEDLFGRRSAHTNFSLEPGQGQ